MTLIIGFNGIKVALKSDGRLTFKAALLLSHAAEIYLRNHTSLKTILKVFTLTDKYLTKKNNNSGKTNRA